MKYPKEYLDEIKTRLKVSTVVSKFVNLKKRGKEYIGLSPFKNEKTPSFTVNDEKEFYHCFASSEHGNIFDFVMKTQNLNLVKRYDIWQILLECNLICFQKKMRKEKKNGKNIHLSLIVILNFIMMNFKNEIHLNVRNYLKNRSLNKDDVKKFKLGYVEKNPNFL